MSTPNLPINPLTPDQFAAFMHAAIAFLPMTGPDAIQWQIIKDMTARVSLEPARPAAPARTGCNCTPHN